MIRLGRNLITVFINSKIWIQRCTEGRQCEDIEEGCDFRGIDWGDEPLSQNSLKMADTNRKSERDKEGSCPRIFRYTIVLLTS